MKKLRDAAARARRRTQTLEGIRAAIDDLTARGDIHDVLYRYARGIDRCDLELLQSSYLA